MEEIELAGAVMLPIGSSIRPVDYVNWNNRSWLAPVWLEAPHGNTRQPLRLIAPRYAPGFTPPPGPEVLNLFQRVQLTQHVLEQGFVPDDLVPLVEIVESPPVFIRVNSAN